ncbi:putative Copper-containing nitrite reductase [Nitrospira sp. KM1]|uniref:multicopper oxidase domain-containing protein n=1 Tax=Nitrospira sp. KM1 TaxID=1936990 RepID=UPI0013A7542C|nr:multicopper oxidase domain-containing protein [Nitrospira sp. KM1]BCA55054.1 putative Copper-containing nitrite reductase [Nitrospira sp. KM1]
MERIGPDTGVKMSDQNASVVEEEARAQRLGWALLLAAAAGLFVADVGRAEVVTVQLRATVTKVEVAKDDQREAWTFNESFPGPVIRVKEGDIVDFTLKNEADRVHSIDFHAAKTPWNLHFQGVPTGSQSTFRWKADYPGVFYYHCGTDPMIQHIANGMFGAVVVEPRHPVTKPDREYVIVQSEVYPTPFDVAAMMAGKPKLVVFNGKANKYLDEPLRAKPGELIRLHVVNAGPNHFSAFHVIGAIFDRVYASGNPKNVEYGVQTYTLPPGGGATFDLIIPEEGMYPMVTHSLQDALTGALGVIHVAKEDSPKVGFEPSGHANEDAVARAADSNP